MQKFLMALTTAALVSCVNSADAALILGSQAFTVTKIVPDGQTPPLDLFGISEFTELKFETTSGTIDFPNVLGTVMGTTSLNSVGLTSIASPTTFSFAALGYGTFTGATGVTYTMGSTRSFEFTGTFVPSFGVYEPTLATIAISFTQVGGRGNAISGSGTFASLGLPGTPNNPGTPGLINPEPASIAMFGTMLVPLALGAFRRRQKAAQAAL